MGEGDISLVISLAPEGDSSYPAQTGAEAYPEYGGDVAYELNPGSDYNDNEGASSYGDS